MQEKKILNPLIIKNLIKKYESFKVINNISFSLPDYGSYGLVGPNGAGKTTLIGIILGLITPTAGKILILGKNFKDFKYEILQKLNFASPYLDLPKKLSVFQNLLFYARMYNLKKPKDKIHQLSNDLKIIKLMDKRFGSLSAGQKTKVSICKSLLNDPKLLLLDEPTSSLDPETSNFIRNYLFSYQKKNKMTILIASHNMSEIEEICDKIIILKKGEIFVQGSPKEILEKNKYDNLEDFFINGVV